MIEWLSAPTPNGRRISIMLVVRHHSPDHPKHYSAATCVSGIPQYRFDPERIEELGSTVEAVREYGEASILLVDDEEDILPEYQDFLELHGLASLTCADPERAVEIALAQPSIKVVITDLRMAKLDGASLIQLLRATLPAPRHIEFLILTGYATLRTRGGVESVPVFMKPVDTDALVAAIRTALAANP